MIKKIIEELTKLERLEEIANNAEIDYDREPENMEYEKAFDDAYRAEYKSFMAVARMKEKNLERLYTLLERAEREHDTETAAALRWAIFELENR